MLPPYLLLFLLVTACDLTQQSAKKNQFSYSGNIMGTTFTVKIPKLPDEIDGKLLKMEIMALLLAVDGSMSTYNQDSELTKINANNTTEKIPISTSLFAVLAEAQRVGTLSNGAFDVSVGTLINLWGFGPDKATTELPSDLFIKQTLQATSYDNYLLDQSSRTIKKLKPNLNLDLSGLAKGYAVDQVAALLESKKLADFLVEIGGELKLKGRNGNNEFWKIAIEKPIATRRDVQSIIKVTDIAIASSGDYRNFFAQEGRRYSHIIDPKTGRPVNHNLVSVTVLNNRAMTADALATAFMVLGVKRGLILADKEKIAVLFFVKAGNDFFEQSSNSYQDYFEETR